MSADPIQIARYPNRRFYAREESRYVSLQEIEKLVKSGRNVEIRESQTDEDITRLVLTRIIMERQPEKMLLFPTAMLHFILRSNDAMTGFLRDYFRHSLTYLDYLQRHSGPGTMARPMHWVKAWLDGIVPARAESNGKSEAEEAATLARRVEQLEQRLRELESDGK
jgi:polyhydroxyalkanoate synthesis repressor PhaR